MVERSSLGVVSSGQLSQVVKPRSLTTRGLTGPETSLDRTSPATSYDVTYDVTVSGVQLSVLTS